MALIRFVLIIYTRMFHIIATAFDRVVENESDSTTDLDAARGKNVLMTHWAASIGRIYAW